MTKYEEFTLTAKRNTAKAPKERGEKVEKKAET